VPGRVFAIVSVEPHSWKGGWYVVMWALIGRSDEEDFRAESRTKGAVCYARRCRSRSFALPQVQRLVVSARRPAPTAARRRGRGSSRIGAHSIPSRDAVRLALYADWVQGQVNQLTPDQVTRSWGAMWNVSLSALYNPLAAPPVTAVYEHASLVVARWEFLGALYQGTAGDSGVGDARGYADRFLPAGFAQLHNLSGACQAGGSEFFAVFRNKSLHGFTPAGVYRFPVAGGDVFGWSIGAHPAANHRQLDALLNVQLDSATLQAEFVQSVSDYADYLGANVDAAFPLSPQQRWKKGFWGRFRPVNYDRAVWEQEGRGRRLHP
jgi:hypothetical protein